MSNRVVYQTLLGLYQLGADAVITSSIIAESIQLTTGSASGYIISGDVDGHMYWTDPNSLFVTSAQGTANQIFVNGDMATHSGAITLSLPQNIATTSDVQFNSVDTQILKNTAGTSITLTESLIPDVSSSYTLGTSTKQFGTGFFGTISAGSSGSLYLGNSSDPSYVEINHVTTPHTGYVKIGDGTHPSNQLIFNTSTTGVSSIEVSDTRSATHRGVISYTHSTDTWDFKTVDSTTRMNLNTDLNLSCNLYPNTTSVYSIGSSANSFQNCYLKSGTLDISSNTPVNIRDSGDLNLMSVDATTNEITLNDIRNTDNFSLKCLSSSSVSRNFTIESNSSQLQFYNATSSVQSYAFVKSLGAFYVGNKTTSAINFAVDCSQTGSGNSDVTIGNPGASTNRLYLSASNTGNNYIIGKTAGGTTMNQIYMKNNLGAPTSAYTEYSTTGYMIKKANVIYSRDLSNNDRMNLDFSNTTQTTLDLKQPSANGNNYIRTYNATNTLTSEMKIYQAGAGSSSSMTYSLTTGGSQKTILNYEPTNFYPNTDNEMNSGLVSKRWIQTNSVNYYNGTGTRQASACMDLTGSTSAGLLPPKLTTTQKNAISTPASGLVVFDTTVGKLSVYNGSAWVNLDEPTPVPASAYYFTPPVFGNYALITGSYAILSRCDANTGPWQTTLSSQMFALYKAPYAWSMNAVRCVAYRSAATPPSTTGTVYLDFRKNGTSFYTWTISSGWNDLRTLGSYEWDVVNSFSGTFASGDVYSIWVTHNLGASNWQLPLTVETVATYT